MPSSVSCGDETYEMAPQEIASRVVWRKDKQALAWSLQSPDTPLLTLHHLPQLFYLSKPTRLRSSHTSYRRTSTSAMSSEYMIRARLTILVCTLLSLAVAILSSAKARFAFVLRDRVRSDYINTVDDILDNRFQSLQNGILSTTAFMAVAAGAFAIYGVVIMVHSRWLREEKFTLQAYAGIETMLGFVMIVTGGVVASNVQGFQTSFEKFGANKHYDIMYYGGIAEAAYGSVLVVLAIAFVVFDHYKRKQIREMDRART